MNAALDPLLGIAGAIPSQQLDLQVVQGIEVGIALPDGPREQQAGVFVESALARVAARAPQRVVEQRDKLREAVRELLDGVGIDEQRVALEIALLAERLDVQEELSRFASHVAAFRATLAQTGGDPVGKRLGFLLQEMLRETNTTGSKANDAAMLANVVTIKEELERLREQVENLE